MVPTAAWLRRAPEGAGRGDGGGQGDGNGCLAVPTRSRGVPRRAPPARRRASGHERRPHHPVGAGEPPRHPDRRAEQDLALRRGARRPPAVAGRGPRRDRHEWPLARYPQRSGDAGRRSRRARPRCLAKGVSRTTSIYAGGQGLFETDLGVQGVPIPTGARSRSPIRRARWASSRWVEAVADDHPDRDRIAVLREDRRIVIATRSGVFWSDIPGRRRTRSDAYRRSSAFPRRRGRGSAVYGSLLVEQGGRLPDVKMGFLGLAAGPPRRGGGSASVAVASWGEPGRAAEFYWGGREERQLVMHPATVRQELGRGVGASHDHGVVRAPPRAHVRHQLERRGLSVCPLAVVRRRTLLGAARAEDGRDAGAPPAWPQVPRRAAGNFGDRWDAGPKQLLAVSRDKPDVVVVGWRFDRFFVSEDAGASFRAPTSPGMRTPTCMACTSTRPTPPASGSTPRATAVC